MTTSRIFWNCFGYDWCSRNPATCTCEKRQNRLCYEQPDFDNCTSSKSDTKLSQTSFVISKMIIDRADVQSSTGIAGANSTLRRNVSKK